MRRAALIYNPAAGMNRRKEIVGELESILVTGGVEVDLRPTEGPGHATEIAHQVARTGSSDSVLVFGGDGTLREAAKGLLGTDVALAPLAAGTTNVVARSLRLPVEPRRAARRLLDATPVACKVGMCNQEPFLILASLGIDAAIMARVSSAQKNLGGRGAVILGGLATLARYGFPETDWEADGQSGRASFVAACNIAEYGGDFRLAPDASFFSHQLILVTFTGRSRTATIRFAVNLILGRHLDMPSVSSLPFRELRIPCPLAAPLQLDGDHLELEAPLEIRLSKRQIHLLSPAPRS